MNNDKDNYKFNFAEMPSAFFCDNNKATSMRNELIKNQVRITECEQGDLEDTFFSSNNIKLINKQLIMSVYKKTNNMYKISEQSPQSLIIVMRYVWIEYAKHLPYDIKEQVIELNNRVVGEILPGIMTQVTQRVGYLKDIMNPVGLVPLPRNTSNSNKDLPSVSKIIFNK